MGGEITQTADTCRDSTRCCIVLRLHKLNLSLAFAALYVAAAITGTNRKLFGCRTCTRMWRGWSERRSQAAADVFGRLVNCGGGRAKGSATRSGADLFFLGFGDGGDSGDSGDGARCKCSWVVCWTCLATTMQADWVWDRQHVGFSPFSPAVSICFNGS